MKIASIRGQCIYTRLPLYPVGVHLDVNHSEDKSSSRPVVTHHYQQESLVHSDVLDEDENGELTYVGNDFSVLNVIEGEDTIPDFLYQEFYFDAVPTAFTYLEFPLKGKMAFTVTDFDTLHDPVTGRICVFASYRCRTETLRYEFVNDCLKNGWRYA